MPRCTSMLTRNINYLVYTASKKQQESIKHIGGGGEKEKAVTAQ